MIHLYGISYRCPNYLVQSLDSILANTSEELCITVVDSLSHRSAEIREIGAKYVDDGKIKRFISCNQNCKGFGLKWAYENYPPEGDFFIFTDLDLVLTDHLWLDKLKDKMEHVSLSAARLSLVNAGPPNGGHRADDQGFGFWLMGVKRRFYDLHAMTNTNSTQDCHLLTLAGQFGGYAKYDTELYHLGWDLWRDDPDYFNEKARGINWLNRTHNEYNVYEAK